MNKSNDNNRSLIVIKSIIKISIIVLLAVFLLRLTTYVYDVSYAVFRDAPNINKEKKEYVLNVQENMGIDRIAELLYINGIIEDKTVFKLQAKLAKIQDILQTGNHKLNSFMSSEDIFANLAEPGEEDVEN